MANAADAQQPLAVIYSRHGIHLILPRPFIIDLPAMDTRERDILQNATQFLATELSPRHIYLFGSRAKGKDRKGSDFDLALDGPTPSSAKLRAVKDRLDAIAGLYSIDIAFLADLDEELRQLILKTGRLVYEQK